METEQGSGLVQPVDSDCVLNLQNNISAESSESKQKNPCIVAVSIEIGHQANFLKEPTAEGYTHHWTLFVEGYVGNKIEHFVEKVVFNLHPTFKMPTRVISEPPYRVSELGYAGFVLPIDIYFKTSQKPHKIRFMYDLFLNNKDGPPVNNVRYEKLKFQNPSPNFKAKLIKAGGMEQESGPAQTDSVLNPQNLISSEPVEKKQKENHEVRHAVVKPEPGHNRRNSSESRPESVSSVTMPSPSSTPSSHHSSKTAYQATGTTSQSAPSSDIREIEDGMTTSKENGTTDVDDPIDCDSRKGIFGWDTVDETSIPYLLRKGRKFVSVRIVECKLLSKYPNTIPDELAQKDPLVSQFITEAEANLLNEINTAHCDYEYGHSPFTVKDLIVDLEEFLEFFKIVKRNFPEDILASINVDTQPQDKMDPILPASDSSQYCGWVQINNTVSPYIIRSDNNDQVKLVPLSVIVYAAGLLTGSHIEGLLPTIEECTMLNAACKAAGFDFTFARNTRLIAIAEVVQRCQVQIFELPVSNPLQYAQYLDGRMNQPPPPSILRTSLRNPPPYPGHMVPYQNVMGMERMPSAMMPNLNPLLRHYPPPHPPGVPSHMPRSSGPPNINVSRLSAPNLSIGHDSKTMHAPMHQTMAGNSHYPPSWPGLPGQAPPAHKPSKGLLPSHDMHPSPAPSSSSYQPMSLPPSPLLHSNPSLLIANRPIYGNSGPVPRKDGRYSNMMSNKPTAPPPLPSHSQSPQHTTPPSPSFGVNQFNSSLFARSESSDSHKQRPPVSSPPSSSSSYSNNSHQNRSSLQNSPMNHMLNSAPNAIRNTQNSLLVKNISACLVSGKSISCLHMDGPSRRGKFCLVEAVSKLYFPTVPIMEFVKVLKVVLMAKLHECTPEEEAAFVQYYNLPVPKLKCNQMIMVDDLQKYFPQLNYVFNKGASDQSSSAETSAGAGMKRPQDSSASSGPPSKHSMPKLENVVQKLHQDKRPSSGDHGGPSDRGSSSSVIVIDD